MQSDGFQNARSFCENDVSVETAHKRHLNNILQKVSEFNKFRDFFDKFDEKTTHRIDVELVLDHRLNGSLVQIAQMLKVVLDRASPV